MNLGFFASHGGSNLQAVLDACKTGRLSSNPALLIGNNRKSMAIERAMQADVPTRVMNGVTHPEPAELDSAMLDELLTIGSNSSYWSAT